MTLNSSEHRSCGPSVIRLKLPLPLPGDNFKTEPIRDSAEPRPAIGTALGILEVGSEDARKAGAKNAAIRILVVEDNPGDLYLIRASLSLGDIPKQLSVVTDGEEALQFLSRTGSHQEAPIPDLILLDLNLPKVDGREVLERIKADPEWRHIPVVVLSTSTSERDVAGAYENHANCYLSKPHGVDEYLDLVHEIESYWLSCVALPSS